MPKKELAFILRAICKLHRLALIRKWHRYAMRAMDCGDSYGANFALARIHELSE